MPNRVEIRITVDKVFLKKLGDRLGFSKPTDIVGSALTILEWASAEVAAGRLILSSTRDGGDIHRLVMPELNRIT